MSGLSTVIYFLQRFVLVVIFLWPISIVTSQDCMIHGVTKIVCDVIPLFRPKVVSFQALYSIDNKERAKWHQLASYCLERDGCRIRDTSKPAYCRVDHNQQQTIVFNITADVHFSNADIRAAYGTLNLSDGDFGSTCGPNMPRIYAKARERIVYSDGATDTVAPWPTDGVLWPTDGKPCDFEMADRSIQKVEYCFKHMHGVATILEPNHEATSSGNCLEFLLQPNKSNTNLKFDDTLRIGINETKGCGRRLTRECTLRKISPYVLSLGPFNRNQSSSSCDEGVTEGDYFYYTGWVRVRRGSQAPRRIKLQMNGRNGTYTTIDNVYIRANGCSEITKENTSYCSFYQKSERKYNLIINMTASSFLNNRRIRLRWDPTQFGGYVSRSQAIPTAHKIVSTTLDVSGKRIDLSQPSRIRIFPLERDKTLVFKFCVENLYVPYILQMHAEPGYERSFHSYHCLVTDYEDTCKRSTYGFRFRYTQYKGCLTQVTYKADATPFAKLNGAVYPVHEKLLQKLQRNEVVELCMDNIATPYELAAVVDGMEVNSSSNACVQYKMEGAPGRLSVKTTDVKCKVTKEYLISVHPFCDQENADKGVTNLTLTTSANFAVVYSTSDLSKPCMFSVNAEVDYDITICVSNRLPPIYVNITVDNNAEPVRIRISSCITVVVTPNYKSFTTPYIVAFADKCSIRKKYNCTVTLNLPGTHSDDDTEAKKQTGATGDQEFRFYAQSGGILLGLIILVSLAVCKTVSLLGRKKDNLTHGEAEGQSEGHQKKDFVGTEAVSSRSNEDSIAETLSSFGTSVDTRRWDSQLS